MNANTPEGRAGIGVTHASEREGSNGRHFKETARAKAGELGERAKEEMRARADEQMTRARGEIGALASALHTAGSRLDEENRASSRLIHIAAEQLDELEGVLENRSLDDLMREARMWARRSPGMVLGGAIAVGFLASRFLKAGSDGRDDFEDYGWMDQGDDFAGSARSSLDEPSPIDLSSGGVTGGPRTPGGSYGG